MIQLGFSDMLNLAQTIGIVGTNPDIVFLKKQIQGLSIEQQTTVPHIEDIL